MPETDSRLSTGQIRELIDLDGYRFKASGDGIRPQVQNLIRSIAMKGLAGRKALRHYQALTIWETGLPRGLGYDSFEKYLASIPVFKPSVPEIDWTRVEFPILILVDGRINFLNLCAALKVRTPAPLKRMAAGSSFQEPYWMFCQDGIWYLNLSLLETRRLMGSHEWPLTPFEGLWLWLHCPQSVRSSGRKGLILNCQRDPLADLIALTGGPDGPTLDEYVSSSYTLGYGLPTRCRDI